MDVDGLNRVDNLLYFFSSLNIEALAFFCIAVIYYGISVMAFHMCFSPSFDICKYFSQDLSLLW